MKLTKMGASPNQYYTKIPIRIINFLIQEQPDALPIYMYAMNHKAGFHTLRSELSRKFASYTGRQFSRCIKVLVENHFFVSIHRLSNQREYFVFSDNRVGRYFSQAVYKKKYTYNYKVYVMNKIYLKELFYCGYVDEDNVMTAEGHFFKKEIDMMKKYIASFESKNEFRFYPQKSQIMVYDENFNITGIIGNRPQEQ